MTGHMPVISFEEMGEIKQDIDRYDKGVQGTISKVRDMERQARTICLEGLPEPILIDRIEILQDILDSTLNVLEALSGDYLPMIHEHLSVLSDIHRHNEKEHGVA